MRPLYYKNGILKLIDQTKLPSETIWHEYQSYEQVAKAIKDMIVRERQQSALLQLMVL